MSKLPKAPLIEVIFELRWTVGPNELQEVQYLHGDLYPLLKDKYPFRETLHNFPAEFLISVPTHRFRSAANDYPLVQIGPGILTLNTTDAKYYWETFEADAIEVVQNFMNVYPFKDNHTAKLTLQYIDLIEFDFEQGNMAKYLDEFLHISLSQDFYKGPLSNLALALNFENKFGLMSVNINRGKSSKGQDGIAIQTNLTSAGFKPDLGAIRSWLREAHEVCSASFKEMTKGKLYTKFLSK